MGAKPRSRKREPAVKPLPELSPKVTEQLGLAMRRIKESGCTVKVSIKTAPKSRMPYLHIKMTYPAEMPVQVRTSTTLQLGRALSAQHRELVGRGLRYIAVIENDVRRNVDLSL